MPKMLSVFVALAIVVAACGDGGGDGYSSCDDVAQGGIDLLQGVLDEVSAMSMEEFLDEAGSEDPSFVTNFEADADELDAAQTDLGCSDDELSGYLVDNLDQLEASGPVGELMLEAILADPSAFEFGE
jgi:hypothetical protein